MRITHLEASNWRNFKNINFDIAERLFIVGPNAAGKSNLLDVFRFMSDIASRGGGLATALERRGGLKKVRSLYARNNARGRLILDIQLQDGGGSWRYRLEVKGEQGGKNRPIVDRELVERNGEVLLNRPDEHDKADPELLTQTHLEQIAANHDFRPIAEYFARVQYFHLVPQMIRYPQAGGASPRVFGSSMIADMNATPVRTRQAWFRRIERALQSAVPGFETLRLEVDKAGQPHLIAGYRNWRRNPSEQNETDFSDGTLRLIGLLWTIISSPANGGVLLLEEPELSLNAAVVQKLASLLAMAQRGTSMQVILSTHSPELLDDEGIRPEEVLVLQVTSDATVANQLSEIAEVEAQISADLPLSEVVAELINPGDLTGLIKAARR